jgi:hypothetical protein
MLVRLERPEVRNKRRGKGDERRSGAKVWVRTSTPETLML